MLIDTGPIVAILDVGDSGHRRCTARLQQLPATAFVTTWPSATEAMYLLDKVGGHPAQEKLWNFIEAGTIHLFELTESNQPRMRELMTRYKDAPMDLADASPVVAAEDLNDREIFTLDQHFHAHLIHDQFHFLVVP